ncbi:MAG: 2-phospho-L-lactate transferase [Pelolinea sp.]|nr:2-phospho-L-lactate transferase [Pelolinea sp.]
MKIAALAGGVGGAKLAQGLAKVLGSDELSIIVNTGDDFEHLGLYISPDIDTVCYTLADKANVSLGWGLKDETYKALEKIGQLNGPTWFKIGDSDLATHLMRTQKMKSGETLTHVTRDFCELWGIKNRVLPMSDDPVRTFVDTKEKGLLPFQEYFVKHQFELCIRGFYFKGIDSASPTKEVIDAIKTSDAVIICPSNPFVSIDPILSLRGIKDILKGKNVIAVSPLIGGKAIKGPLAKMFREMNIEPSVRAITDHYGEILDCLFFDQIDQVDMALEEHSCIILRATNILLPDIESRIRLAAEIVEFLKATNKD